ncbi:hypothetical protein [Tenacibaculum aestuariivivum]|uniref:hypothetical protein n=1 Tax=Tenacibaculum aestuariivivum TaxID=2006131 RepID=UPI003AB7F248
MLPKHQNSTALLISANTHKLYTKLIQQLNKDFSLANFDFKFIENTTPLILKEILRNCIKNLIINDSATYKNVLYVIDVSEKKINNINASDIDTYTDNIVFLILKRVWKKVWFKAKYTSL